MGREKRLYFLCLDGVAFPGGGTVKRLVVFVVAGVLFTMGHAPHPFPPDVHSCLSSEMDEPSMEDTFRLPALPCCAVPAARGVSLRFGSSDEPFPAAGTGLAAAPLVPEAPPPERPGRFS